MPISRPVILTFIAHYLPGYRFGGPIRTLANLVERLGDEFDFRIVTLDRDVLDSRQYPDIQVDAWNTIANQSVYYLSSQSLSFARVWQLIREVPHDLLYLNSCFDPRFTLLPLIAQRLTPASQQPVVLAPRGELAPGALRLKAYKKKPFLAVARMLGVYRNVTWQASSGQEAEHIRRAIKPGDARIHLAPDLPPKVLPVGRQRVRSSRDSRVIRVVFLSRICRMKNLDYALSVLGRVSVPVDFSIYGAVDDNAYWRRCQEHIECLPHHVHATYHGEVRHEDVHGQLCEGDLFLLPTRGESFGHTILEALAAGTPVIISDNTPWRDLESAGVGWTLPLDNPGEYADAIEHYGALSPEQRTDLRRRAIEYARQIVDADDSVEANRALLSRLS